MLINYVESYGLFSQCVTLAICNMLVHASRFAIASRHWHLAKKAFTKIALQASSQVTALMLLLLLGWVVGIIVEYMLPQTDIKRILLEKNIDINLSLLQQFQQQQGITNCML